MSRLLVQLRLLTCRLLVQLHQQIPPHQHHLRIVLRWLQGGGCVAKTNRTRAATTRSIGVRLLVLIVARLIASPGAVCQDPRFIGADGITFYFHGKKDQDFWVQSLGILFDNHQIIVGAKKTATWDNAVDRLELSYDGTPLSLAENEGAKWQPESAPGISISRSRDTNAVVIEVEGNFKIKAAVVPITEKESTIHKYGINNQDCFAHLDLGFKFYSLSGDVNGVLGQTYASNYVSRAKMGVDMPVLGGQAEFASSSLVSTDCAASSFKGTQLSSSNGFQYANLKCSSGLDGRGVVCKR